MLIIVTMREEALVAFKVKVGSFKAPFNLIEEVLLTFLRSTDANSHTLSQYQRLVFWLRGI